MIRALLGAGLAVACVAAAPTSRPQQFVTAESDPASPRKSHLTEDKSQIIRTDVDGDGDPDILEAWWNGKRVRWIDENDDMKPGDLRGDMASDSLQIDRDGD